MKNISLIVSFLTAAIVTAALLQVQTYNMDEVQAMGRVNDGLQCALAKTGASIGQEKRTIALLQSRLNALTNQPVKTK